MSDIAGDSGLVIVGSDVVGMLIAVTVAVASVVVVEEELMVREREVECVYGGVVVFVIRYTLSMAPFLCDAKLRFYRDKPCEGRGKRKIVNA